jgi:hypothetical protein
VSVQVVEVHVIKVGADANPQATPKDAQVTIGWWGVVESINATADDDEGEGTGEVRSGRGEYPPQAASTRRRQYASRNRDSLLWVVARTQCEVGQREAHLRESERERERGTCQLRVLDTQLLNQVLQRLPAAHLHLLGLKGQIVHQHLVLCAERLVCRWSASPIQGVTPESLGAVGTLHALTEVGSPQGLVVIRRSERNWQLLDAPPSPACGPQHGSGVGLASMQ